MSFFAGAFTTPQGTANELTHPGVDKALRVSSGARIWRDPAQGILAHSQSLITPEDHWEQLPIALDNGRQVLVFDGRLDNREDLIRSLGLRGDSKALPDGVLVAAAIERWHDDACPRLLGDFAYACWNMVNRQLLLACDPTGGRTILYHANNRRIVFATTVESMLAFPGISREVELSCIARLLADGAPPLGSTAFRDIKQLPAAHNLTWSARGMTVRPYWRPDFASTIRYQRDEEYVEHARELLDEAVRCRLRTIGPVGCHLSGGFDSAGVTATAARLHSSSPVFSVTAVPQPGVPLCPTHRRSFADEWKHASAVAGMHPNLTAYAAPATAPAYTDPRILFHLRGMPVRNFLNVSWFSTANQMPRDLGARVLLIGAGGNVTLSWSGMSGLADLAGVRRLGALRREVLGLSRRGFQSPWQTVRRNLLPAMLPAKLRAAIWPGGTWQRASAISAAFALASDAEASCAEDAGQIAGLSRGNRERLHFFEQMWRRPGSALLRPLFGLDRRDPLADIRLVQFCISLPPEQYLLDGVTRRLARRVLADRLPASVLDEHRVGRQNPEWFFRLSHAREQMRATLDRLQRSPLATYVLDLARMRWILEHWPANSAEAEAQSGALIGVLARGANIGEFLEWTENGCPPPSSIPDRTGGVSADPVLLAAK